MMPNAIKDIIC